MRLAIDGILAHSSLPLRISFYVGLVIAFAALLLASFYLMLRLFFRRNYSEGVHDYPDSCAIRHWPK